MLTQRDMKDVGDVLRERESRGDTTAALIWCKEH